MFHRLVANWVYGGFLAGLLLLALTPLFAAGWDGATTLVLLALPVYMIHQYEEHDADSFRRFVNARLGGGREILTLVDVFWINIVGVWVQLAADVWLAARLDIGWGVFAAYFLLVNAAVHIVQAIHLRCYNPGLGTAVTLFPPLGFAEFATLRPVATLAQSLIGAGVTLVVYAAIMARVRNRLRASQSATEMTRPFAL